MRFFVHGISGWVGHYVEQYVKTLPNTELYGTYRNTQLDSNHSVVRMRQIKKNADCLSLIREIKPDFFLNLSRGETDEDFKVHQEVVQLLNSMNIHYAYASSFNACDGQLNHAHEEHETPNAQSDYGKFKARCELELQEKSKSYTTFRFSATHGWAGNREGRTENILRRLQAKEVIPVNRGVLQNRTFVYDLAGMMVDVTLQKGSGVFNLGTIDYSEEVDFLQKLAVDFGYSKDQIVPSELTPTNAFMVPQKILKMFGKKWKRTEADTLAALVQSAPLQRYRNR